MYTEFPKKFKAYVLWPWKIPIYLPTQPYVKPLEKHTAMKRFPNWFIYNGTLTEEQTFIADTIKKRMDWYEYHCGLINMKTGKGKSHIIMKITSLYSLRTLIMCHNKKTLLEMVEKFKEFTGYEPWVYYGDKKDVKDITITTHDSFVNNNGRIPWCDADVIIYDECDYNLSQNMFNALCLSWAKALYGLTWTPYTKNFNNEDMQKIFGKQISFQQECHQTGYNFTPIIETYRYRSNAFKEYEYNNWAEEKQCLVDDKDRLHEQIRLVRAMLIRHRQTILVLTERVEEATNYYNKLLESTDILPNNPSIILITWETKIKDDNKQIEQHVGKWPCIIIWTVWKMARGVDIPQIDTVMLFSALHFRWTVVQAVWRWLRNFEWKEDTILVDWQDYPILANQWYERKKAYIKEYKITDNDILFFNIVNGQYERKAT